MINLAPLGKLKGKGKAKNKDLGSNASDLINLHNRRRQPEMYIQKQLNQYQTEQQNTFNQVLKKSLLSPSKQRDVSTFQEKQ